MKRTRSVRLLPPAVALLSACSGTPPPTPDPTPVDSAGEHDVHAGAAIETVSSERPGVLTRVIDIGPLTIDGLYRSMDGPAQCRLFDPKDVKWVTGFRIEVFEYATGEAVGDELFCHSQPQIDTDHRLVVGAMGIAELVYGARHRPRRLT